jgi:hypothetical protein
VKSRRDLKKKEGNRNEIPRMRMQHYVNIYSGKIQLCLMSTSQHCWCHVIDWQHLDLIHACSSFDVFQNKALLFPKKRTAYPPVPSPISWSDF